MEHTETTTHEGHGRTSHIERKYITGGQTGTRVRGDLCAAVQSAQPTGQSTASPRLKGSARYSAGAWVVVI